MSSECVDPWAIAYENLGYPTFGNNRLYDDISCRPVKSLLRRSLFLEDVSKCLLDLRVKFCMRNNHIMSKDKSDKCLLCHANVTRKSYCGKLCCGHKNELNLTCLYPRDEKTKQVERHKCYCATCYSDKLTK